MKKYQQLDVGVWDLSTRTVVTKRTTPELWAEYEAWLTAGGILLPPDSVGQMELAEAKTTKCAEINSYAASLRNKIIAGRSAGEMVSWAIKLLDAMAVSAAQPNPFLSILPALQAALGLPSTPNSYNHAIAMVRGITEADHILKVLNQAVPFIAAEAAIDGTRGKHCDYVNNATTVEEIILYNWKTGWPVL